MHFQLHSHALHQGWMADSNLSCDTDRLSCSWMHFVGIWPSYLLSKSEWIIISILSCTNHRWGLAVATLPVSTPIYSQCRSPFICCSSAFSGGVGSCYELLLSSCCKLLFSSVTSWALAWQGNWNPFPRAAKHEKEEKRGKRNRKAVTALLQSKSKSFQGCLFSQIAPCDAALLSALFSLVSWPLV